MPTLDEQLRDHQENANRLQAEFQAEHRAAIQECGRLRCLLADSREYNRRAVKERDTLLGRLDVRRVEYLRRTNDKLVTQRSRLDQTVRTLRERVVAQEQTIVKLKTAGDHVFTYKCEQVHGLQQKLAEAAARNARQDRQQNATSQAFHAVRQERDKAESSLRASRRIVTDLCGALQKGQKEREDLLRQRRELTAAVGKWHTQYRELWHDTHNGV
jgi:chromosome segregation ATPase